MTFSSHIAFSCSEKKNECVFCQQKGGGGAKPRDNTILFHCKCLISASGWKKKLLALLQSHRTAPLQKPGTDKLLERDFHVPRFVLFFFTNVSLNLKVRWGGRKTRRNKEKESVFTDERGKMEGGCNTVQEKPYVPFVVTTNDNKSSLGLHLQSAEPLIFKGTVRMISHPNLHPLYLECRYSFVTTDREFPCNEKRTGTWRTPN